MITLFKKYFRGKWSKVLIVLILQTIQTLLNLVLPTYNASIINDGVMKGDTNNILHNGAIMLGISGVQVVCSIFAVYIGVNLAIDLGRDLRRDLFTHSMNLSQREVAVFGPSSLTTRLTNDIQQIQQVTLFLFTIIITAPISLVGGVIMAVQENVQLSATLLFAIPALIIIAAVFIVSVMPFFRKNQKLIDNVNEIVREQIVGNRVIRAFVREKTERRRFKNANTDIYETGISIGRRMGLIFPLIFLVINCTTLVIMYYSGYLLNDGSMEIGSITAFLTYVFFILMSLMMASIMFVMFPRAMVSAKRALEVMNTDTSISDPENPVKLENPKGVIEFKNVDFQYPNAEAAVLKNISFTINPGKVTAIIGSTGSGKTTVARLIPRLFDVTSGEITFDGVNIKDLSVNDLNAMMGIVPQRAFLFSGTIRSNLLMAKPDATDEQIWAALEIAQSADFVKAEEGQLDAEVATGGNNFSGGQKQRLCIARSILRNPLYYQFDDSFSALDYATDHKLRYALYETTAKAAVVIIAQRVSTIKNADQIVVLNNGEVAGIGKHLDLIKNCEVYKEIVESQMTLEEAGAGE